MTRTLIIESAEEYQALATGKKNFVILNPSHKINEGDTVIFQHLEEETALTCAAVQTGYEEGGLKKGWQAISLKAKE